VADPEISFGGPRGIKGAEVERRRREDRGAEGAEGGGVWEGGIPLPSGGGAWGGGIFQSFIKKWRVLVNSDVIV